MKKAFLFCACLSFFFPLVSKAQQIDPVLTATVELQTLELQKVYKTRDKTQKEIIVAQTAVAEAINSVHNVEKQVLNYMGNASSAMDNLYQLKRAGELVTSKIPSQIKTMIKAVPANYQGTAVTTLTTNTANEVYAEMASLYSLMSQLVTSTKYSFDDSSSDSSKKNVNLLSASERYYIANEVVSRLEKIYNRLWFVTWQVQNLGWEDAWRNIDSESWSKMNNGKAIADDLIRKWNNAKSF